MNKKKYILFIIIVFIIIIYLYLGNTLIQTEQISITDNKIPLEFDGYKIVQISDLHNAKFGDNQEKLISKIKKNNPDIIVVTGDLIDSRNTDIDTSIDFIKEAIKLAPIYYVSGNHEARIPNKYTELKNQMTALGVTILENQKILLQKNTTSISLIGVNDPLFGRNYFDNDINYMKKIVSAIDTNRDEYRILLSHRPELFEAYSDLEMDLVFSGHAHGGQFRIPFVGGLLTPNQGFFPKYTAGLYENEKTKMIVSRGLGNSSFPLRINNNPHIIVATLKTN